MELYYEIYDLPEEAIFTTEIMLLRESEPPLITLDPPAEWISEELAGKRPDLQLSFEESGWRGGRPWLVRRKTLSLTDIRPGNYVLVLAVTPAGDAGTVYRLTPIRVNERVR